MVKVLCYKSKVAGSIPAGVSGFFIGIKSFRSHYGPGVDSACNRNEYQEYFSGGKGGRCVRLKTLPPSCAVVTKSGNLNFLDPFGPVQACNGTDLPLHLSSGHCVNVQKFEDMCTVFEAKKDPRTNSFLEHCLRKYLSRIYSVSGATERRPNKSQVHFKVS